MVNPETEERSESSDSRGPPAPPAPRDDEDMYYNPEWYVPIVELENRQLRKQLAEANKWNEELARLVVDAQAAQPQPL